MAYSLCEAETGTWEITYELHRRRGKYDDIPLTWDPLRRIAEELIALRLRDVETLSTADHYQQG